MSQTQFETSTATLELDTSIFDAAAEECVAYYRQGFLPPPDFTIGEYAEEKRVLSSEASNEPGPWRNSRTPYLNEIMDELSPSSHTEDIVFMKGSQVGATEVIVNAILYNRDCSPGPILAVQPTIDMAKKFSRQRLQSAIGQVDEIQGKPTNNKSRDAANTVLQKDFPGGTLIIGGANSAAALRMMPIRYLYADEIDGYPDDVDGEGDPLDLAIKRTTNWNRRKRYFSSTPTVAEFSRIQARFELSDQRYYYVPCPYCKKPQILRWENIRYDDDNHETARYVCDHCKAEIQEYHKTWMLEHGRWIKHKPKSKVAGFHLSALYSPLGWYSWQDAVKDHLDSRGKPLKRKVWVNTVLGEVWEESETSTIDTHWLMKRRESYKAVVPAGVLCLTAGVDHHPDRLECTVTGWGIRGESWIISHDVFLGNTHQNPVWDLLDLHLQTEFEHERGVMMYIAATGIDAMGTSTDAVYDFCRPRKYRRVLPFKGMHGPGRAIVSGFSKSKRAGGKLFLIGVDQAKDILYCNLQIKQPGPGYIHLPTDVDEIYLKQLTAEKKISRRHAGLPKSQWVCPPGKRNEALDCYVYSLAALKILNPNLEVLHKESLLFTSDFKKPTARKRRGVRAQGVSV